MPSRLRRLPEEAEEVPVKPLRLQPPLRPLRKQLIPRQLRRKRPKLLHLLKQLIPLPKRKRKRQMSLRLIKKIKKENNFHAFLLKYEEGLSFGSIPFFMFFSNY